MWMKNVKTKRKDKRTSLSLSNRFLHVFNPLHVYCRLRDCFMPKNIAIALAKILSYIPCKIIHFLIRLRLID